MNTKTTKYIDRHRAGTVQLKAWVPAELRQAFLSTCTARGLAASVVLRAVMQAYIDAGMAEATHG